MMGPLVLCGAGESRITPGRRFRSCTCRVPPTAGVLLSGGLDSSLVAAIAARKIKREGSVWGKLHSFCVGLEGSPDLKVQGCGLDGPDGRQAAGGSVEQESSRQQASQLLGTGIWRTTGIVGSWVDWLYQRRHGWQAGGGGPQYRRGRTCGKRQAQGHAGARAVASKGPDGSMLLTGS